MNAEKFKNWVERLRDVTTEMIIAAEGMRFHPCIEPECFADVVARGRCSLHYRKWRRGRCLDAGVKNLRDIPKEIPEDPNQLTLFEREVEKLEDNSPDIEF